MKTTPDVVEQILSRSVPSAMPLPRLVEAVNRELGGPRIGRGDLLRSLRSRPDLFRTLDPLVGPWRRYTVESWDDGGWAPDPWVIGLSPERRPQSAFVSRLNESLRCLGRQVDGCSTTSTARWLSHMERGSTALSSIGVTNGLTTRDPWRPSPAQDPTSNHPERHSCSSSTA